MNEKEKMLAGELYDANYNEELIKTSENARFVVIAKQIYANKVWMGVEYCQT